MWVRMKRTNVVVPSNFGILLLIPESSQRPPVRPTMYAKTFHSIGRPQQPKIVNEVQRHMVEWLPCYVASLDKNLCRGNLQSKTTGVCTSKGFFSQQKKVANVQPTIARADNSSVVINSPCMARITDCNINHDVWVIVTNFVNPSALLLSHIAFCEIFGIVTYFLSTK